MPQALPPATSLSSLLHLTLEAAGLAGIFSEYLEVVVLPLQPAASLPLSELLARPAGLRHTGGDVHGGGLTQWDLTDTSNQKTSSN